MYPEISDFVATRLCHDLAGPLGAVNNGVEFWRESDATDPKSEALLDMVEMSAKEAISRLLYYRQAFGLVHETSEAQWMQLAETAAHYLEQRKISLVLPAEEYGRDGIMNSALFAKCVLNLMLVVADTLIHGGTITVKFPSSPRDGNLLVEGKGKSIKVDQSVNMLLTSGLPQTCPSFVSSRNVQAVLALGAAQKLNLSFTIATQAEWIAIRNA